jgi:hypothetical protein
MGDTLQRQAVPAYFHPDDGAEDWSRLAMATSVELVVANVSDGPGLVREEQWADALRGVRATGSHVVGYVDTGYLGLTGLGTRLGSTFIDDWIEQILHDVTNWYWLYGDQLTGIFFDQVAESDDGPSVAPVLRRLREHVRQLAPDAITVLNPGMAVPPAFADLADVLVTFEGPCDAYLSKGGPGGCFEPLSWEPPSDQAIWHIIHNTPTPSLAQEVVALSRQRGADLLYVTDGTGANPYASLPSEEIWAVAASDSPDCTIARSARSPLPVVHADRMEPDDTLISNPTLVRRQHTIEASADFFVESACRRVFLASRRRNVPRWWTGSSPQIAADWLIENNRLYAYAGEGTDWTWTPSGQVTFEAFGRRVRWCMEADRLGLDTDTDADAAFHVCAPGYREYSAVATGCHAGR